MCIQYRWFGVVIVNGSERMEVNKICDRFLKDKNSAQEHMRLFSYHSADFPLTSVVFY